MLPKSKRATSSHIDELAKGKKTLSGAFFTMSVRFVKNPLEISRFAVIVSKKVAKTAVSRNKLRRQAYSALENKDISLPTGMICAFYAKKEAEKAQYTDLSRDISELISKI